MKDKSKTQLTVSGAAQILKIPESTIRSLERRNKLSASRDSAGRRLFDPAEISRFAKDREVAKADIDRFVAERESHKSGGVGNS